MGLQPLKEFHRAFSPIWKRFSIDLSKTDRGSNIVTELADHDLNHYKAAGIKVGDEIVGINGYTLTPETTQEKVGELTNTYKVVFDIIRAGEHISITMERDPNEIHGD
jgi:predicted metalloprotease with PDZ domain